MYTNKDLKGVPPPDQPAADATTPLPADTAQGSAPADPVPAPAVSSIGRAGSKAGEKADAKADGKDDSRGEAFWRGRMRGLQEQLEREKTLVEALQSRVNALTTDFVNRDDPGQRAAISADRQKALAELDRTQKAVAADTKAIAALDEEARRAGVPPGWLR